MEDVLNHLNAFLDMKYSSISEFPEQCTLKFFSKDNIDYQNSILINKENKTIVDMKISDTGVFTKILEKFGQENIPEENSKNVELKQKIDVTDFLQQIVLPIENLSLIGFLTYVKQKGESSGFERYPGSFTLNYVIV